MIDSTTLQVMPDKKKKLDLLLHRLAQLNHKYDIAIYLDAGYIERNEIRAQIKEVEEEIKVLKEKLDSP